jgi:hypothetical protein
MTLQLILWAIPVTSLTAASVLLGRRLLSLTRDCFVRRALLEEAGRAALACAKEEPPAALEGSSRPKGRQVGRWNPRPAALHRTKARLEPVPVIVCRTTRDKVALAG